MKENFLRQRRNLYVINGIIIFSCLSDVQIKKLTIAGISFESFNKPEVTYWFIWVVWFYFLYRYVVFFIEEEKSTLLSVWQREIEKSVNKTLLKLAEASCLTNYLGNAPGYYTMKKNNWILNFQESLGNDGFGEKIENRQLNIQVKQLALPWFIGVVRFLFITSAVTNYVLPIVLSLTTFIVAGFSSWQGSLF